jgi:hypothetical protein
MVYGDDPAKWNERQAGSDDPMGLNAYTYVPVIAAVMQSGNLYVYCMGNPVMYADSDGDDATAILGGAWTVAGGAALADGPLPFGDAVGIVIGVGGTLLAGGVAIYDYFAHKPPSLPSIKKVEINMKHIMSGHGAGGNRGGPNKSRFPREMTAPMIEKAIREAYKHAEKAGKIQRVWEKGREIVRQVFVGEWSGGVIKFWFNYTDKIIETAWPI